MAGALALRGASSVLLGLLTGWELKDVFQAFKPGSAPTGSDSSTGFSSVSRQPIGFWVQVGRTIGITLAIIEVGRITATIVRHAETQIQVRSFHEIRNKSYEKLAEDSEDEASPAEVEELENDSSLTSRVTTCDLAPEDAPASRKPKKKKKSKPALP
ncbi:hypothetical protein CYMTET_16447 [Cymbomonas tetramitiformis]|uniref:Uncharacterized protein n=1 Tax=Cymbomonas tetramitiformis TaxID=36881 RepID=A0AAE0GC87_9CHLO|nr:hypothetical protein CYMTET_16447 [Cymbomonas tetramitiformis]